MPDKPVVAKYGAFRIVDEGEWNSSFFFNGEWRPWNGRSYGIRMMKFSGGTVELTKQLLRVYLEEALRCLNMETSTDTISTCSPTSGSVSGDGTSEVSTDTVIPTSML